MDWIALGYLGLFLAAFLAATILPVASEALFLLMLFSFNPWICLFVATAGNTLGGFLNYGIGYLAKPNWLKKVGVTSDQIEKWKEKIQGLTSIYQLRQIWEAHKDLLLPIYCDKFGITKNNLINNTFL